MDDRDDEPPTLESFLEGAARQAATGVPVAIKIRDLIAYVSAERRGTRVVEEIQSALDHAGLITDPPFTFGYIDNVVKLCSATPSPEAADVRSSSSVAADGAQSREIALTVSSLRSASAGAVSVEHSDTLERARSIMLRYDYSQLAVTSGPRRLVGAVSWESMARAAICQKDFTLPQAIVPSVPVRPDADLIAFIPTIIEQGFVFVTNPDHTLGGIVTTADLGNQFGALAKPFILLGEVERRLRRVVTSHFDPDELASLRDPDDAARQVDSAHDLTLGEIVRCLENGLNWQRLSWPLDRGEFISALHAVRELRNDVMHFSPDPLTSDQEQMLHNFARWLRVMEPDR